MRSILVACESRQDLAGDFAHAGGLEPGILKTKKFDLQVYSNFSRSGGALTIFLEGDGYAWVRRNQLSNDPTPKNPIALKIAARDTSPARAYIARPCQYVGGARARGCSNIYWSGARFNTEVVNALAEAITRLRQTARASSVELIGYSGGGTLAVLLAQKGFPVTRVVTIAAVLDTVQWTRFHNVSPLKQSLNPASQSQLERPVKFFHFVGNEDKIVPQALTKDYLDRLFPAIRKSHSLHIVDRVEHNCCWADLWPRLREIIQ